MFNNPEIQSLLTNLDNGIEKPGERIMRTKLPLPEEYGGGWATGKTVEEIARDTERDNFMSAYDAKDYGLIDKVIEKR